MPSAVVLGGGIAGLTSGIALARAGWSVSIHERAPIIEPLGAALSLWPNATAALDRLGVLASVASAGAPIKSMIVADRDERPIIGPRQITEPALMITRAALQRALTQAAGDVPLHLGRAVQGVQQDAHGVTVHFEDGATANADLAIDAGGIRSPVAVAMGGARPHFAGYGGVVALSQPIDGDELDGAACEYWGEGERFGVFQLPEGQRYWFYMCDQGEGDAAPSHTHIAERAIGWPARVAASVAATSPECLIPFAIHAKLPPKALGKGRVISVGDAAHAMEPNLGQGACQAIEDAAALTAIATGVAPDAMLATFERLRLKRVGGIVRRAAEGRHGAHGLKTKQTAMRWLIRHIPDSFTERMTRTIQTMPDYRTAVVNNI